MLGTVIKCRRIVMNWRLYHIYLYSFFIRSLFTQTTILVYSRPEKIVFIIVIIFFIFFLDLKSDLFETKKKEYSIDSRVILYIYIYTHRHKSYTKSLIYLLFYIYLIFIYSV